MRTAAVGPGLPRYELPVQLPWAGLQSFGRSRRASGTGADPVNAGSKEKDHVAELCSALDNDIERGRREVTEGRHHGYHARATTMPLRLGRQRSTATVLELPGRFAGADAPVANPAAFSGILSGPRGQTSTIPSAAAAEVRCKGESRGRRA